MLYSIMLLSYVLPIVLGLFNMNYLTSGMNNLIENVIQTGINNECGPRLQNLPSNNITFTLFSPKYPANGYLLESDNEENLKNSPMDYLQPIKCIIHGWTGSGDSPKIVDLRNAYVNTAKVNVIVVSWYPLSMSEYTLAAQITREVGKHLGQLLKFISNVANIPLLNFHVIGHSLGAHAAGFTGKYLNGNLGRITALDAAAPCFETPILVGYSDRVTIGDANHVDALHTCRGYLGFRQSFAHIDYFPNGGSPPMPGCMPEMISCSHSKALEYWRDGINYPNSFVGVLCDSWDKFKNEGCVNNPTVIMGDESSTMLGGNYYMWTNAVSPFGQNTN